MHALHTDLYQLTMAAGYFHRGLSDTLATCELFVRRLPRPRRYLVAAGVDQALDYVEQLRFTGEQIDFLRTVPALSDAMDDAFAAYLRDFRFSGQIWAVAEGTVMFHSEPFVRVQAPIIEAQLLETFFLSTINHATMIASKAARIVQAAAGGQLMEFGTRRTHAHGAVDAARAAYLAGFAGTSNVEAGMRYGIPVVGTAAHMWTMAHDTEEEAFANYVAVFPNASILLIDTYDTRRGAERAARIAGDKLKGVRLDSGDMLELSRAVRQILDESGCRSARIVASGDLNEYRIAELVSAGAPIDVYGVGTELVTSKDAPSLGGVYKVVQFERDGRVVPIAKFSEGKATYPGPHQVHRHYHDDGRLAGDVLALADETVPPGADSLLELQVEGGQRVAPGPSVEAGRARVAAQLSRLGRELSDLEPAAEPFAVAPSERLDDLVAQVRSRMA